jgi:hypothetical protein
MSSLILVGIMLFFPGKKSAKKYALINNKNEIFFKYKEIEMGSSAKSYMRKGFLIYEEMRKYFLIYEEAVIVMTLQLLHSEFPYI